MPDVTSTNAAWEIHVNYGKGWVHECTEYVYEAILLQEKAYKLDCEYPFKIVVKPAVSR